MPTKAFRIFALATAIGLAAGYVIISLPQGIFGSSKSRVIRFNPDTQPTPTPTRNPHMGSSKLGIIVHPSDLSGEPAPQTLNPAARRKRALMHGPKSAPISFDEVFPGPVEPHLIETKRQGRDLLITPEFWSSDEAWKENLERPVPTSEFNNDPFATPRQR